MGSQAIMIRLSLRTYAFTISLTLSGCILSSYNEGSLGSSAGGSPQGGGGGVHTGGASSVSKGGSASGGVSIVGGASTSGGTRGNGGSAAAAGATITGGSKSAGGSVSTGGLQSSGGANASGGQPSGGQSTGSGGTVFTGGVASTGGLSSIGGTRATGGSVSTGGSRPNGGTAATGGSPIAGGAVATGGSRPTGGTVATGGIATGGAPATGGAVATGGTPATGGAVATGGTPATGGSPPTGGAPATGGTCSGTGGSGGLADCDYKGSPCTRGWYSGAPAMVSADVAQPLFLWHVGSGTMLLSPVVLNAGDTVQSLGVVTSLATSATPATFQLALYANSDPLSLAVPAGLIVETDDLQSAGGDNICVNNVPVRGALTAPSQYTASVAMYAWIALLVKGNNDVVIVGANSASSEPTRCASPITPLSLPGSAPTTTTSNCAPPNRGAYSGATPYLFAVVSPSG